MGLATTRLFRVAIPSMGDWVQTISNSGIKASMRSLAANLKGYSTGVHPLSGEGLGFKNALIKSEIMDWSYTKSTATAKGELEINGGWISQATVALGTDESRNGALVAPLHFGYISLPNDMGIQKVESCETRYQRQTSNYRVKGTILKTEYKTKTSVVCKTKLLCLRLLILSLNHKLNMMLRQRISINTQVLLV